jgi:integrase
LPLDRWPDADRLAWLAACRPTERLKRGGRASHLKDVTRRDLVRRYGYFLDHVQRTGALDCKAPLAAHVTRNRVESYRIELDSRVSSVTTYGALYKLRRIAQIIAPELNFSWLAEIEKDLALVMVPRSKFSRVVYTNILVDAGMTLMIEADAAVHRSVLYRARQFRNGLMVALLALHPIRLKNFSSLDIGSTLRKCNGTWWIVLAGSDTKERRPDERSIDPVLAGCVDRYLDIHRQVLARNNDVSTSLWLSSNAGGAMTYLAVEKVIKITTLSVVGIDVSPHLFRTSAVSTAAIHAGEQPRLGSALLHHSDPNVAEEHYNRASGFSAARKFSDFIRTLQSS